MNQAPGASIDSRIRLRAFEWLREQMAVEGDVLPRPLLARGFEIGGERIPLVSPQGIFQPRLCDYPLTITTAPNGPYDDSYSPDGVYLQYRYRGNDPLHRDNVGLRRAMFDRVPLIYLVGQTPGWYSALWPVFIVGDHPDSLTFTVALDDRQVVSPQPVITIDAIDQETRRRYATYVARRRLHQDGFRERVLKAYNTQCSICRIKHRQLLDAAHIIADSDPEGEPQVRNGLALCKIHHAAFDASILGVTPNYIVEIREDVLEEVDGPMLEHGLKHLHGSKLVLPRSEPLRPDRELLDRRYQVFRGGPR